jgi:hypothetical protein
MTHSQGIAAVSYLAFAVSIALSVWCSYQKGGEGPALALAFLAGAFCGIALVHDRMGRVNR